MRIEYDLTLRDVVQFQVGQIDTDQATRRKSRLTVWGGASLIVAVLVVAGLSAGSWSYGLMGVVLAAVYVLIIPRLLRMSIQRSTVKYYTEGKGQALLGHRQFTITDDGLSVRALGVTAPITWSQITRLRRRAGYVYIYTGPRTAHIIPEDRLTHGDMTAFLEELRAHVSPQALDTGTSMPSNAESNDA